MRRSLPFLASAFRADGGIRTPDQLITNQLLWPTELHRQNQPFWIAKVGIKNLPAKLFPINFSLFYSSQRTSVYRLFYRGEIGCKDRKSFIFYNSLSEKYHPGGRRLPPSRPERLRTAPQARAKSRRTYLYINNNINHGKFVIFGRTNTIRHERDPPAR